MTFTQSLLWKESIKSDDICLSCLQQFYWLWFWNCSRELILHNIYCTEIYLWPQFLIVWFPARSSEITELQLRLWLKMITSTRRLRRWHRATTALPWHCWQLHSAYLSVLFIFWTLLVHCMTATPGWLGFNVIKSRRYNKYII